METTDLALAILRIAVGLTFAAHGAQKVFGWWGGPGMAGWTGAMAMMGFRPTALFAPLSAWAELGGGILLAAGLFTPLVAALLVGQSVVIIIKIHLPKGFFAASGGIEFPFALAAGVIAIGLVGPGTLALDAAIGFSLEPMARASLLVIGLIGGLLALGVPRLASPDVETQPADH